VRFSSSNLYPIPTTLYQKQKPESSTGLDSGKVVLIRFVTSLCLFVSDQVDFQVELIVDGFVTQVIEERT